jgi:hypothetical protein
MDALAAASGAAAAAGFAAAVPLWFCLACPAVMGLLLPLAINLGLGGWRAPGGARCRCCWAPPSCARLQGAATAQAPRRAARDPAAWTLPRARPATCSLPCCPERA